MCKIMSVRVEACLFKRKLKSFLKSGTYSDTRRLIWNISRVFGGPEVQNNRTSVKLFSVGPNSLPAVVSKPCREASPGLFQLDVFNCDIELHKTF